MQLTERGRHDSDLALTRRRLRDGIVNRDLLKRRPNLENLNASSSLFACSKWTSTSSVMSSKFHFKVSLVFMTCVEGDQSQLGFDVD